MRRRHCEKCNICILHIAPVSLFFYIFRVTGTFPFDLKCFPLCISRQAVVIRLSFGFKQIDALYSHRPHPLFQRIPAEHLQHPHLEAAPAPAGGGQRCGPRVGGGSCSMPGACSSSSPPDGDIFHAVPPTRRGIVVPSESIFP